MTVTWQTEGLMGVCLGGTGWVTGLTRASVISQGSVWPLYPKVRRALRRQLEQALLWCFLPAIGAVARATFLGEASAGPWGCRGREWGFMEKG